MKYSKKWQERNKFQGRLCVSQPKPLHLLATAWGHGPAQIWTWQSCTSPYWQAQALRKADGFGHKCVLLHGLWVRTDLGFIWDTERLCPQEKPYMPKGLCKYWWAKIISEPIPSEDVLYLHQGIFSWLPNIFRGAVTTHLLQSVHHFAVKYEPELLKDVHSIVFKNPLEMWKHGQKNNLNVLPHFNTGVLPCMLMCMFSCFSYTNCTPFLFLFILEAIYVY